MPLSEADRAARFRSFVGRVQFEIASESQTSTSGTENFARDVARYYYDQDRNRPNVTFSEYLAIARRAVVGVDLAGQMNDQTLGAPLLRDIPVAPSVSVNTDRIRYQVVIEVEGADGTRVRIPATVSSNTPLSGAQVVANTIANVDTRRSPDRSASDALVTLGDDQRIVGVQLVNVFRVY